MGASVKNILHGHDKLNSVNYLDFIHNIDVE